MKKRARGRPPKWRNKIAALKVRGSIYLAKASQDSIKSIACHLGRELGHQYTTRKEVGGVLVSRET